MSNNFIFTDEDEDAPIWDLEPRGNPLTGVKALLGTPHSQSQHADIEDNSPLINQ